MLIGDYIDKIEGKQQQNIFKYDIIFLNYEEISLSFYLYLKFKDAHSFKRLKKSIKKRVSITEICYYLAPCYFIKLFII